MKYSNKIYASLFFAAFLLSLVLTGCKSKPVIELSGTIEATQTEACSEVAGKVIRLEKQEGDSVKQGDILAVLDSSMQELAVKQLQAVVSLKEVKLQEIKAGTRPQQLDQAELAVKSAEIAVNNASTGVKSAQTTYDYWRKKYEDVKKLNESDTATESDLSDAKYKMDSAKQQLDISSKQLEAQKTQLASAKAQLDLLENGSTSYSVKAAEADLLQSRLSCEQASLVLEKYQVRSAIDGVYTLKYVNTGDLVNAGTSVATISDLGDLWFHVFIPQKYISSISCGDELDLRIKGLDNSMVKGKIIRIADKAEFTPKNTETDDAKENTVFKIKIKFIDKMEQLKPGMTVDAIIPIKTGGNL